MSNSLDFQEAWLNETISACRDLFGIVIDLDHEEHKEHPFLLIATYQAISIHKMEKKQDQLLELLSVLNTEMQNIRSELNNIKSSIDNSSTSISSAIRDWF